MFVCIPQVSRRSATVVQGPACGSTILRHARVVVVAWLLVLGMDIVLESLVPVAFGLLDSPAGRVYFRLRMDLIRHLSFVPALLFSGCLTIVCAMRRAEPPLLTLGVAALSMYHVVSGSLLVLLAPELLREDAKSVPWPTVEAFSAVPISDWAFVLSATTSLGAWFVLRRRRLPTAA